MEQEVHIAGVIVYARPAQLDAVKTAITAIPGADIHVSNAEGKMVVTLETGGTKHTLDIMDAMRALPGVVDVTLVYQHAEPVSALDLEIQP